MKTIIRPESNEMELSRWRGALAQVWLFNVAHGRFALRLYRPGEPDALYIIAVSCKHIVGPFQWKSANLVITKNHDDESRVVDAAAGFELRCGPTVLVKGPSTDLETTFENFLGDDVSDAESR